MFQQRPEPGGEAAVHATREPERDWPALYTRPARVHGPPARARQSRRQARQSLKRLSLTAEQTIILSLRLVAFTD